MSLKLVMNRVGNRLQRFRQLAGEYFGSAGTLSDEPLPEVRKALFEDAPKVVRLTIWSLVGFFLFALLWASFAVVDEVTRGDGKAIPSSKLQKVQNLEGGIVKKLFVHEGQVVNIGDPLIQLDDTRFSSNVGETEADRQALMLRVQRLTSESDGRALQFSPDIEKSSPQLVANERALFESRQQQLKDEVAGLEEQLTQRRQELREFIAKQAQYSSSLDLLREEIVAWQKTPWTLAILAD